MLQPPGRRETRVRTRRSAGLPRPAPDRHQPIVPGRVQETGRRSGADGSVATGTPHPRARLALRVAARRARLQGAAGSEAASWSMALMSAAVVVWNGSVLRAARLRTAAPSIAEMVRPARA